MAKKLFYSMGEVSEMFDVNPSLIRHWESKFEVLKPQKNKKGNRMFTPEDVENLKLIYHLVKERGMTLDGARRALKGGGMPGVARDMELLERLQSIRAQLVEVRNELKESAEREVGRALLAVDVTEEVLAEAEQEGCDLVVTHHPIVFHPLKRLNEADYVQRCVARAVRRDIALYACHTNLDSAPNGMSWRLASELGIGSLRVLAPSPDKGEGVGFGVVGELPEAVPTLDYLCEAGRRLRVGALRHSRIVHERVRRVAVCTGAGGSLLGEALRAGAELYLTADLKYNDFMAPSGRLTVADIGHFESEYCAIEILFEIFSKNLRTFAVRKSRCSCNPVNYLCL